MAGVAVFVMVRSACRVMPTVEPAALLSGFKSAVLDDTDATLTSESAVEPGGTAIVTVTVAVAPGARVPTAHVTVPPAPAQPGVALDERHARRQLVGDDRIHRRTRPRVLHRERGSDLTTGHAWVRAARLRQ